MKRSSGTTPCRLEIEHSKRREVESPCSQIERRTESENGKRKYWSDCWPRCSCRAPRRSQDATSTSDRFFNNLAMIGALLYVVVAGPGAYSLI